MQESELKNIAAQKHIEHTALMAKKEKGECVVIQREK